MSVITQHNERVTSVAGRRTESEQEAIRWLVARSLGTSTLAIAKANKVSTSYVRRQIRRAKDITIHWRQERLFQAISQPNFTCDSGLHAFVEQDRNRFCLKCFHGLNDLRFVDHPSR